MKKELLKCFFFLPPHANLKVTYDSFHLNNISGIFLEIEAIVSGIYCPKKRQAEEGREERHENAFFRRVYPL